MIISITEYVDELHKYLSDNLSKYFGIASKKTEEISEGSQFASFAEIYDYTMPSSALVDGYPSKCPVIVIRLDNRSDINKYTISLCICVSYNAVSEREKARPIAQELNVFEFDETQTDYETESDRELIKTSILYTDIIYNLLLNNKELAIENIQYEMPSADLPEFPYCITTITFDTILNRRMIGQDPYADLY